MNELATHYLQVYAEGGEADKGWMYGKALRQARLDYSPESLGRLDAVVVFAAAYGAHPMRMVVSFPYRPAAEGRRLEILRPAVREADVPADVLRKLNAPLERGIRDFGWTSGPGWDALYQA